MNIDKVFHLTKQFVSFDEIMVYKQTNIPWSVQSRLIGSFANGPSTMLFTSCFAGSLFMYTALSLSDARLNAHKSGTRHEDNKSLNAFNKIALPVIFFLYVQLILGVMIFFYGITSLMQFRNPSW